MKLTKRMLQEAEPDSILMSGTCILWRERRKFVVVRGGIPDWAIYYGNPYQSDEEIAKHGDKITSLRTIQELICCDDDVLENYRL